MTSQVLILERPELADPILIEGLPGIGFVANISALHLITELKAKLFARIHSPAFQNVIMSTEEGTVQAPVNELYYARVDDRDLIVLHGNTQALTSYGQYELCGRVLDVVQELGCRFVACMGGLRRRVTAPPKVFGVATDEEILAQLLERGVSKIKGHIVGAAGILLGLGKLRGMRGFCILVETTGLYPDPIAAEAALRVLCDVLKIRVDLSRLSDAAQSTKEVLMSFTPTRKRELVGLV